MNTCTLAVAALLCAAPVAAQQAPPATVDLATALRMQHRTIRGNIVKSAEKVAEADYGFKPQGVAAEVRTFGQFLIHLANANNAFCARAKGDTPKPNLDEKTAMAKADIMKSLNEALTYCDGVYDALTDASVVEKVKVPGPNNTQLERSRGGMLVSNLAHNNEHYGNLVTYMRAKGLVPPSSEGR
jgi:uncharacterized damage-inducible protein DinB